MSVVIEDMLPTAPIKETGIGSWEPSSTHLLGGDHMHTSNTGTHYAPSQQLVLPPSMQMPKMGNPGPVGLAAFGITTVLLNFKNCGVSPEIGYSPCKLWHVDLVFHIHYVWGMTTGGKPGWGGGVALAYIMRLTFFLKQMLRVQESRSPRRPD